MGQRRSPVSAAGFLFIIRRRKNIVERSLKKSRRLLYYFISLLLTAAIGGFWFNWATKAPSPQDSQPKIFVVKRGEKTDSIAKRLYKEGLVQSPSAFKLFLYKEGLIGKIQAGDFRLSPAMSALEIAKELTHGTLDYWVTIIEGWRAGEIIQELNFTENTEKFVENEGYLFPDTYLIPKDASAEAIIKILKKNFDKKIEPLLSDIQKSNLGLEEVIILASIVEREAKYEGDWPIVAGILIKRWRNGWPLQADATVQYAFGKEGNWWPKVKKQDLKIDSLYNTYKYKGLPPTPICNPGLSAIKAVVYPKETDYWYYLSDKKGKMHYAKTLEEHNRNIQKFLTP